MLLTCFIRSLKEILISWRALFAYTLLLIIGWKIPDPKIYLDRSDISRAIIVFSHTSYVDFIIFLLYSWIDPIYYSDVKIIMQPKPFQKYGWILKRLGCVSAPRLEDSGTGFVDSMIQSYQSAERVHFLISPKGSLGNNPWRSGYYWLAKGLKAKIIVAGLDYAEKRLVISDPFSYKEEKDILEGKLKAEMAKIVPLYPERDNVSVDYDRKRVGIVNVDTLVLFLTSMVKLHYLMPMETLFSTMLTLYTALTLYLDYNSITTLNDIRQYVQRVLNAFYLFYLAYNDRSLSLSFAFCYLVYELIHKCKCLTLERCLQAIMMIAVIS